MFLVHVVGFVLSSCGTLCHAFGAGWMKILLMNISWAVRSLFFISILDQGHLPRAFRDTRHKS